MADTARSISSLGALVNPDQSKKKSIPLADNRFEKWARDLVQLNDIQGEFCGGLLGRILCFDKDGRQEHNRFWLWTSMREEVIPEAAGLGASQRVDGARARRVK